jgi:hypothetical protein
MSEAHRAERSDDPTTSEAQDRDPRARHQTGDARRKNVEQRIRRSRLVYELTQDEAILHQANAEARLYDPKRRVL